MNSPYKTDLQIIIHDNFDNETFEFIIPDKYSGSRIDLTLSEIITDLSRTKLTNWLKEGFILIDQKPRRPKDKILGGETVLINPPVDEQSLAYSPEDIPLNIVYEDEHILVINKPAGLTVHPGNGNWSGTLLNGLLFHEPKLSQIPRAGIVHRLDKDTRGLMVVAKTLLAQTSLIQQLQNRKVSRIYRAIAEGHLNLQGIINENIGRDPKNRIRMTTLDFGGREAITHYRRLYQFKQMSYIECQLETGRTHQIRVHFKHIGHPLIGDQTYGKAKVNYEPEVLSAIQALNRQALHAIKLSFNHPATGKLMDFKINLADDIRKVLQALATTEQLNTEFNNDDEGWEIIYVPEQE